MRVNKEIVHLTYSRHSALEDKRWSVDEIFNVIASKLRDFCAAANPTHLAASTRAELIALTKPLVKSPPLARTMAEAGFVTTTDQRLEAVLGEPGTIRVRRSPDSPGFD